MIRVISVILLCTFLSVPIAGAERDNRIYSQTIQKLVDTEASFDQAEKYYHTLLRTAEVKSNESMQSECLLQLSRIHYWQAQYSMSLVEAKKALSIAHRLNDKAMLTAGYDLLGRLHYLYSPEQAQYYYRKCWQYNEQSDSAELAASILNNFNMILKDREIVLDELLSVDIQSLGLLNQARLSYNIARAMLANGRTDNVAGYLDNMQKYLQQNSEKSPINAMYEYLSGQLKLIEGDTKQAWEHWDKSMSIVRKNRIMIKMPQNYHLASQIAEAENKEKLALYFFKKSVMLRDSILNSPSNLYFTDELIYTMMDYIAEDRAKAAKKKYILMGICSGLALITGIGLFYYFQSSGYRKKDNTSIVNFRDHSTNRLHSSMKNHLMKIMYGYKVGVNYYMKQVAEAKKPESTDDMTVFEKNIQKMNYLMDALLGWVDANPEMTPEKVEFDVSETVQQLVDFYKIGFTFKSITCRVFADQPIMARGDKYMFIIALEHLFSNLFKAAAEKAIINVSVSEVDGWYVAINIADPGNKEKTIEKEVFSQRVNELENTGMGTHTADWDFNIFAECTIRNHSKARMECTPEKGTVYYYMVSI